MIATEWAPTHATDLLVGQRVRQGEHTVVGRVEGWRYRRERGETVVDVIYDGGAWTQWVVPDHDTVWALPMR